MKKMTPNQYKGKNPKRGKILDRSGTELGRIYPDGTTKPSGLADKIGKNAVGKAKDALKVLVPLAFSLIDPFDSEALANGELPDHLLYNQNPCE